MKKTPDFEPVRFTLLLVAGSLCVGRLTAQAADTVWAGNFTLPSEVRWGAADPTGGRLHSHFELATFSSLLTVRGNSKAAMSLVVSVSQLRPMLADVSS